MAVAAKSIKPQEAPKPTTTPAKSVDSTFEATASLTPELVVALCGPIGSPLHETAAQIKNALSEFGYLTEQIRLSDLIRINTDFVDIQVDKTSRYTEIDTLIKAGDELRRKLGNDILAKMAIAKIGADRMKSYGDFSDRANEERKHLTSRSEPIESAMLSIQSKIVMS